MEEQLKLVYLAGLFDGEGTVTLTKHASKYRIPVLSMTSTSLNLLEICKATLGGHISRQKVYKEHYKQSWGWKVGYNSAITAAERLIPFIQEPEKKRRLQLILSQYKSVTPRNGKYTEKQLENKLAFEQDFFHPSNSIAKP